MWFVTSNSRVTGFPGSTPDRVDTVLLTVERNLLTMSMAKGQLKHDSNEDVNFRNLQWGEAGKVMFPAENHTNPDIKEKEIAHPERLTQE